MEGNKLAVVGLLLAALAMGAVLVAGPVGAQEQLENETTVPGVDAGENRTITTTIDWNDSAVTTDTATIEVRKVGESYQDPSISTDTETVEADPGNVTTTVITSSPINDVDEFEVNVSASDPDVVDDVEVSSDASSGGGGGSIGGSTSSVLGGLVVVVVAIGGAMYWRDRQ